MTSKGSSTGQFVKLWLVISAGVRKSHPCLFIYISILVNSIEKGGFFLYFAIFFFHQRCYFYGVTLFLSVGLKQNQFWTFFLNDTCAFYKLFGRAKKRLFSLYLTIEKYIESEKTLYQEGISCTHLHLPSTVFPL